MKLNKQKQISVLSLLLAGCLAFNGYAGAFGETPPVGLQIKEFNLLDTASDVVGSADFTPEGNKDGHFKLQLSLAQKTTINAVVLRSTDDYGKDNYQGVWRTNRMTTGWLLGMVQDKTITTANGTTHENIIVNPGFRKDVKEPVGYFEGGELTFDLYASDNGTIKETQYYVLEIETPQGTVSSKPIKYKKPMTSGGTPTSSEPTQVPSQSPSTSPAPVPTPSTPPAPAPTPVPAPSPTPADGPAIQVFFKRQELQFDSARPILKDGSTLVPFRRLFETLGFTVKWEDTGKVKQAIGTKDGLTIELTINSTTAKVNGNPVSMDIPTQIINGNTLVPLRFVAENSGYQVSFSSSGTAATIQIEEGGVASTPDPAPAPEPAPAPATEEVEPYIVKGYVRDAKGHPQQGVTVFADNTLLYDSNILAVTDDSGHYVIELPQMATSWRMGADFTKSFNGKEFTFHLNADVDQPLTGSKGAVRNFTWNTFNGQIYIYPNFSTFDESLPEFNMSDLEMTLTPVGPLIDGNPGQTIIKRGGPVQGGGGVDGIPIGRYKASARWVPEGHAPIPLQVRVSYTGKYADSVEFEFAPPRGVSTSNYLSELEVQIP
ncbi:MULTISPECIES: stalk domain-containing protein [unclassified Paenibacillus]|uniref:stalk domain-containing protein n=1 Tax=unclassified Paenibacillus TaxID=185978 RepID=UPI00364387B5